MKRYLFVFIIIWACLSCNGSEKVDLEAEIQKVMSEYEAIGASVVVVKNNKICYHQTFGYNPDYNDTTLRKPIPEDGIYWLASVSKTFISTAIMQLMEKRKLKLDDDINKYLKFSVRNPKYPETPITVRMLLCHRSSLNDNHYGWSFNLMKLDSESYYDSFNEYEPGEKYDYCNLGYTLLGAIIETVTGMRFDEYIDRFICEPLHLEGSFNLTRIDSEKLVRTYLYDKSTNEFSIDKTIHDYKYVNKKLADYELGISTSSLSPAGGMRISATDLAKWMMVHMNYGKYDGKRIIKRRTEKKMWKPYWTDQNYAFAFSQYDKIVKGEKFIGMTGGSHGISSVMFFNPFKKYGFVVITNGYKPTSIKGRLSSLARELVRPLYNEFISEQ